MNKINIGKNGADLRSIDFDGSTLHVSIDNGYDEDSLDIFFDNVQFYSFEQDIVCEWENSFNEIYIDEKSDTLKRISDRLKNLGDIEDFMHFLIRVSDIGLLSVVANKFRIS